MSERKQLWSVWVWKAVVGMCGYTDASCVRMVVCFIFIFFYCESRMKILRFCCFSLYVKNLGVKGYHTHLLNKICSHISLIVFRWAHSFLFLFKKKKKKNTFWDLFVVLTTSERDIDVNDFPWFHRAHSQQLYWHYSFSRKWLKRKCVSICRLSVDYSAKCMIMFSWKTVVISDKIKLQYSHS